MFDQLAGLTMLLVASVVFSYYTAWTLLMPFVDADHPLQALFLPREWAIRIPVILIVLGSAAVGSFVSMTMIKASQKKRAKLAAQQGKKSS